MDRGNLFLQKLASSRKKIAKIANPFIADGTVSFYSLLCVEFLAVDPYHAFTVNAFVMSAPNILVPLTGNQKASINLD